MDILIIGNITDREYEMPWWANDKIINYNQKFNNNDNLLYPKLFRKNISSQKLFECNMMHSLHGIFLWINERSPAWVKRYSVIIFSLIECTATYKVKRTLVLLLNRPISYFLINHYIKFAFSTCMSSRMCIVIHQSLLVFREYFLVRFHKLLAWIFYRLWQYEPITPKPRDELESENSKNIKHEAGHTSVSPRYLSVLSELIFMIYRLTYVWANVFKVLLSNYQKK